MKRARTSSIAALFVVGAVLWGARPARACGGFFCNQVPIDQSGEQIIFSVTPNHVTAYIQISYAGAAQDFAWVVPVAAKPDISLGSQSVFQAVAGRTQPSYAFEWAGGGGFCGFYPPMLDEAGARAPSSMTTNGGVTVLDSQDVGPFMTVTLASHDSAELVKWLNDNGFQQPPEAAPLIDHYVKLNMLFVALRLKQDAMTGDIQPIVLDMPTADPCVPLILTKIAAQIDMPVQVYILAAGRAFPENWFHVVIDEAKIDWLNNGSNYRDLVTAAIDQAAGHGFVTEFAGSSALMKNAIYGAGQYDTSKLAGITDPGVLIQTLLSMGYPRDATMQALLRKWIPMPASVAARGVTERQFYNDVSAYKADLDAAGYMLDINGFIADLQTRLIAPLMSAQAMFDAQPYLTRLLSTVSPDEMTRDPIFTVNKTLPDVSNSHVAKGTGACQPDGSVKGLMLQLEDGRVIDVGDVAHLYSGNMPWTYGAALPAASRIELVGPEGAPVPVEQADVSMIDKVLDTVTPEIARTMVPPPPPHEAGGGGCACSVGAGAGGLSLGLGLAGAMAVVLARRRRARR
jgi:MYXO-CTERM domain-containing protein